MDEGSATFCSVCGEEKPEKEPLCGNCDERCNYPEDYIYDLIKRFPKTRSFKHCDKIYTVSNLKIYGHCSICLAKIKLRSFGAPKEIQDIILLAKEWLEEAGEIPSE